MSDDPETLFHYTTAQGLLGILESSCLWASDLRFLNDAQEGLYAKQLLVDELERMPNPVLQPDHRAYSHGQQAAESFDEYRRMLVEEIRTSAFGVFVACFCLSGDLLSQWRAYGTDHGYAVELSVEAIEAAATGRPLLAATGLRRVQYGQDAAQAMVARALDATADFNLNHPGTKAWHKAVELTAMLATVKDPGFREENEWRLIGALIPDGGVSPKGSLLNSAIGFRATPIAIVPYIKLPISIDAIVSVRVGPGRNGDVRQAGVEALLSACGSDAKVVRSTVPLRA